MLLPLGMTGVSTIPADQEPAVLSAMKGAIPKAGLYFFPGGCMEASASESQYKEWEAKIKEGPYGILVYHPGGGEPMSPKQLGTEFGTDVLAALIASILLTTTRLGYTGRVGFVTLLGLFGWVTISLPYWNWYQFPLDFTLAAAVEEGVGWLLAGVALAAIVRPSRAARADEI
jgi:hypothetical protein